MEHRKSASVSCSHGLGFEEDRFPKVVSLHPPKKRWPSKKDVSAVTLRSRIKNGCDLSRCSVLPIISAFSGTIDNSAPKCNFIYTFIQKYLEKTLSIYCMYWVLGQFPLLGPIWLYKRTGAWARLGIICTAMYGRQ